MGGVKTIEGWFLKDCVFITGDFVGVVTEGI